MSDWNPNGCELIAAERERQVSAEGWTAGHDDRHDAGELLGPPEPLVGADDEHG